MRAIQAGIHLLKKYLESESDSILFVNGDDIIVRQYLESQSIQTLRDFVGNHRLLVVDEAQYVEKIGLNLKLIVDHIPEIKVIVTGSSSFDLARDVGESLTDVPQATQRALVRSLVGLFVISTLVSFLTYL